jgi:RHS repeat-associated protein
METAGRTVDFAYDQAGREVSRHFAGMISLNHAYDSQGRLSVQSVTGTDGRTLRHRAYSYRADGYVTGIEDQLEGVRNFDLDRAGRVTAVRAADWTERYAYDSAGNQTQASWPTSHPGQEATGTRTYTGTRITRAGNVRFEHDALGRVVLRRKTRLSHKPDTWRYEWDAEDHLTAVVTPDGTVWRYSYDPLGRRTRKVRLGADGETVVERVDFTWDGTTLCEQTTADGALPNPVTLTWDHQGQNPISQTERITAADAPQQEIDSRFFAIVTDLVGAPRELIDEQGTVAWRTSTTLWGSTTWHTDATTYTPLRFPGQYCDPETGLHFNYFRHYDPETARYLSPDPLGLAPAPNPAAYVHNPHTWADPLGLSGETPLEWVDPAEINFSQRTVSPNDYVEKMRAGEWDWTRPGTALQVMNVDGQLVSYDNRRLDAAREVGEPVAVVHVNPNDVHPASTTGRTWAQAFERRMTSGRNRDSNGNRVPRTGLSERPTVEQKQKKGCKK